MAISLLLRLPCRSIAQDMLPEPALEATRLLFLATVLQMSRAKDVLRANSPSALADFP